MWHKDILADMTENGFLLGLSQGREHMSYFCAKCKMVFPSKAAMVVHAFKMHRRCNELRYFVTGRQCSSCLKHYATTIDLVNHAKRSKLCREYSLRYGAQTTPEPGANSRGARTKRTDWHDPFQQAEGPQDLLDADQPVRMPEFWQTECSQLRRTWDEVAAGSTPVSTSLLEEFRRATADTTLFPEEVRQLFIEWKDDFLEKNEDVTLALLRAVEDFVAKYDAHWMGCEDATVGADRISACRLFEIEAGRLDQFSYVPPQLPEFDVAFIAHLFSGRRRSNDLQQSLESLGFATISIDIIFDPVKGNLLRKETFQFFSRSLAKGEPTDSKTSRGQEWCGIEDHRLAWLT